MRQLRQPQTDSIKQTRRRTNIKTETETETMTETDRDMQLDRQTGQTDTYTAQTTCNRLK